MNNKQHNIFEVWSDELENRLDPFFYQPHFKELFEILRKSKYQTHKLSEIAVIFSGQRPKGGVRNIESGIPSLGGEHVLVSGEIKTEDLKYIPEEFHQKHLDKKVLPNDIILVKDGATTGKVGIIPEDYPFAECNINEHVFAVRITSDNVLSKYLFSVLFSEIGQIQLSKNITGATVTGLTREAVESLLIPVPNEKVQQKIVAILGKAYEEKKQKEAEILKILSSIDDFVLGELGIDIPRGGAERVFQIWSDEVEGRIDALFYKPYFKTLQRAIESKNYSELGELVEFAKETWDQKSIFDDQFPYIEISNIDTSNGEIAKTDFVPVAEAPSRAKMIVRDGDIIVSTTRPNRGAITPISKEQDGFIASTGFAILRDLKDSKVLKDYLFVALRTSLSLRQMEQRTTGGNYPAITTEDLRKIKIVVPEIKTQEKIVAGVKAIYEKTKRLRQEAENIVAEVQKEVEQMILA